MRACALLLAAGLAAACSGASAQTRAVPALSAAASAGPAVLRFHGTIEPVRSQIVTVPRLAGSGNGPMVIVHLARAGTVVRRGDPVVEFDRAAQIKNAHDREAEYRDFVEQINKKRADQIAARAKDETELVQAEHAARSAELDMLDRELVAPIKAEQNSLILEEARAKLTELRRTFDLKRRSEAADLHILEIQRDRAANAWKHAEKNAEAMRIASPIDGLVVLKTIWKSGSFGEMQEGEEVRGGQPVLEVVDTAAMRVRTRISQADFEYVRAGMPARVTLDAYPTRQFDARLDQLSMIGAASGLSSRVRTFLAVFTIDGADPHLLPDLSAAVDVDAAPAEVSR